MARSKKGAAPLKSGPLGSVFLTGNTSTNSPNRSPAQHRRRPPRTSTIMASITAAMAEIDPADRPQLLAWVTGRGLLGLAHERGFGEAAGLAYRYADTLAGGVR